MSLTRRLPVLHLTDSVVLPGMVVPIELDEAAQAAVDAARSVLPADNTVDAEVLLAPRLADRYATHGVIGTVEKVGRMPGGAPAAVLRAGQRARIGSGVTGPGQRSGSKPNSSPNSRCPIVPRSWRSSTRRWWSPFCSTGTPGR